MYLRLTFILLFWTGWMLAQQIQNFPLKKYEVAILDNRIQETSGLEIFGNQLLTINDSGNPSEVYFINKKTGVIDSIITIGVKNTDWEAIAIYDSCFYIGDFGNNFGTRKDLKIIEQCQTNDSLSSDSYRILPFEYPEQTDFTPKNLSNDYDAEAMMVHHDKLSIFTKEWASKGTSRYQIQLNSDEKQRAEKMESISLDYVVTDAAYYDRRLYLIGYTKGLKVYLSIFNEDESGQFFSQPFIKLKLGNALQLSQIEGIAVDGDGIYISGEKFHTPLGNVPPKFYFIPKTAFNY